jgi:hypothetical protein
MHTVNVIMEDGAIRQLRMKDDTFIKFFHAAQTVRLMNNQQRVATQFLRRMRSIRATRHLVRR